ncbi:hypothetical protein K7432_007475 [Basidiobolus ranarum]|uniref:Uncharacterized protein n=1 Tax=Basidiobolus ranarum TaxID=34480 RepID=A0ABR2WTA4_9FUNG
MVVLGIVAVLALGSVAISDKFKHASASGDRKLRKFEKKRAKLERKRAKLEDKCSRKSIKHQQKYERKIAKYEDKLCRKFNSNSSYYTPPCPRQVPVIIHPEQTLDLGRLSLNESPPVSHPNSDTYNQNSRKHENQELDQLWIDITTEDYQSIGQIELPPSYESSVNSPQPGSSNDKA